MTLIPQLSLFSPAKINLFLHIIGKREDGYHNLQTVFRLLDWGDTLDFYVTEKPFQLSEPISETYLPITLSCNVQLTDKLLDNLIVKAANGLINWVKNNIPLPASSLPSSGLESLPVIHIRLNKNLPTGAGLGGGSSNAATTLLALTKLWRLPIDQAALMEIGASIGADVPIFLFGKDAIAEGIGEVITPIELPKQNYLILNPNAHASTQALFAYPELKRDVIKLTHIEIIEQQSCFVSKLKTPFGNVFEPIVIKLVPEVRCALEYLIGLERITQSSARMTGTGSSVYLPIPSSKLNEIEHYIEHVHVPPCHWVITHSIVA